ncbi:unnamed protein product [Moneuplotes crassus]|uniref:C2H2-type domain-containing protein n=1 Tax=Euplotes crassus TaxID=5936 RepID=A0AAD1U8P9_EUPCR|nr:unnamed protein product [Moneuplotes crassus]
MIFKRRTIKTANCNKSRLFKYINATLESKRVQEHDLVLQKEVLESSITLESLMNNYCMCESEVNGLDFLLAKSRSILLPFQHKRLSSIPECYNKETKVSQDSSKHMELHGKINSTSAMGENLTESGRNHSNIQRRNSPHSSAPYGTRNKYDCTYAGCKKLFRTARARTRHIRLHFKFRPYQCHLCSKQYTQKVNLKKHLLKHSQPDLEARRVYECNHCDKKFTEKYTVTAHQRRLH